MDLDRLRKHYESLSDEALLEINRDELVAAACVVLDAEIAARGLDEPLAEEGIEEAPEGAQPEHGVGYHVDDDWLAEAATAFGVAVDRANAKAPEMERACAVMAAAGIPYDVNVREIEGNPHHPYELELLVPGKYILEATSILDRDVFNAQSEEGWRDHFAALTDEDLAAIDIRVLTAGWADRIERLTRAYKEELAKRRQ